jgi:hypothetical protein
MTTPHSSNQSLPHALTVRWAFSLALLLNLLACSSGTGVSEAQQKFAKEHYAKAIETQEPLCVRTSRVPVRAYDLCIFCKEFREAGLLRLDEQKQHVLTDEGQQLYEEHMPMQAQFCFARAQVHAVVDALAPQNLGADNFQSFKIVLALREINELLYDPRFSAWTKGCNTRPEPGKAALCDPRIATFVRYPNGEVELRDDVRYGAWVNQ